MTIKITQHWGGDVTAENKIYSEKIIPWNEHLKKIKLPKSGLIDMRRLLELSLYKNDCTPDKKGHKTWGQLTCY